MLAAKKVNGRTTRIEHVLATAYRTAVVFFSNISDINLVKRNLFILTLKVMNF